MQQDDLQLIRKRIEEAQNIAIFAHIRPDGDSIGSVLALGWALEDMGKAVQYISVDPIPNHFHFLFQYSADGENPFVSEPNNADCYILPDISSIDRAGDYFLTHPGRLPDICIDHHISNPGFAQLNWIEAESPAACAVLAKIMPQLGMTLSKRVSSALLCGIITDTNSFSNTNVNAESLRSAATLVDNGADIYWICYRGYKEHTAAEMAYWKIGMNNLHVDGEMIWTVIRKADRDAIGYTSDEDPGFVSYMVNTEGIKVSVLISETNEGYTKISWRSLPGYNVADVAIAHGGGGHKAASGTTIKERSLDELVPIVLENTKRMLISK